MRKEAKDEMFQNVKKGYLIYKEDISKYLSENHDSNAMKPNIYTYLGKDERKMLKRILEGKKGYERYLKELHNV